MKYFVPFQRFWKTLNESYVFSKSSKSYKSFYNNWFWNGLKKISEFRLLVISPSSYFQAVHSTDVNSKKSSWNISLCNSNSAWWEKSELVIFFPILKTVFLQNYRCHFFYHILNLQLSTVITLLNTETFDLDFFWSLTQNFIRTKLQRVLIVTVFVIIKIKCDSTNSLIYLKSCSQMFFTTGKQLNK